MLASCFYNADIASALQELEQTGPGQTPVLLNTEAAPAFPPMDVYAGEGGYTVIAEIPGIDPEKIEIMVSGNVIGINGRREAPQTADGAIWHRREREYGEFSRSIILPFKADETFVSAKASNGLLRLEISKPAERKPARVPVKMG